MVPGAYGEPAVKRADTSVSLVCRRACVFVPTNQQVAWGQGQKQEFVETSIALVSTNNLFIDNATLIYEIHHRANSTLNETFPGNCYCII